MVYLIPQKHLLSDITWTLSPAEVSELLSPASGNCYCMFEIRSFQAQVSNKSSKGKPNFNAGQCSLGSMDWRPNTT